MSGRKKFSMLAHMQFVVAVLLALLLTQIGTAQRIRFNTYSLSQGLSQSTVNAIVQDRQGFIWLGTQDGLNRFDGYGFKVYRHNPSSASSLSDNFVQSLLEDNTGRIWVGTYNGGISIYDPVADQFQNVPLRNGSVKPGVMSMVDDGIVVWVATTGGLFTIDKKSLQVKLYSTADASRLPSNQVRHILKLRNGDLWVACAQGGVVKWNAPTGKFERLITPQPIEGLSYANPWHMYEDHSGKVWVAYSGGGLVAMSADGKTVLNHYHSYNTMRMSNDIWCVQSDAANQIWFGSYGQGLFRLNSATGYVENYYNDNTDRFSLPNNEVLSLYNDRQGLMWVGTLGGGVTNFQPTGSSFLHYGTSGARQRLSSPMVMSILADEDLLYVGTLGGGLTVFNIKDGTTRVIGKDKLGSDIVRCIYKSKSGLLYIGTYGGGLCTYDVKDEKFKNYIHTNDDTTSISANDVWCIRETSDGKIWLGTWGGGLSCFDPQRETFQNFLHRDGRPNSISGNKVISLAVDKDENIWCGTNGSGLSMLDRTTQMFTSSQTSTGTLSNDRIRCIVPVADNRLCLGTDGGGLIVFNATTKTSEVFNEANGLPNNVVYGMLFESTDVVWLTTNFGLCRLNIKTGEVRNYTERDGLQSNEFNQGAYFKDKEGAMYVGGVNGFNKFVPSKILPNRYQAPIYITALLVNDSMRVTDTAFNYLRQLQLPYSQNFLYFEVAALNYLNPDLNKYEYMLEGLDERWIQIGTRHVISYTNLDPGTYTLRVRTSNNDGIKSNNELQFYISIAPPFWQTWWFRALVLVLIAALIYFVFKWRVRNLQQAKAELEQEVAQRTQQVVFQNEILERKNRDITDSINYAKKIQEAILPSKAIINEIVPESFVLYQPKDIVAGDFYWCERVEHVDAAGNKELFDFVAVGDCTGHGVPGAMVSVICSTALSRTVKEFYETDPGKILDRTRLLVLETFEKSGSEVQDGMDISLLAINRTTSEVHWSGANNPLWIVEQGELVQIEPNKQPIGNYAELKPFMSHALQISSGAMIYLFTDGFADQFGGPKGKKYKYKQLAQFLKSIAVEPVNRQAQMLEDEFTQWRNWPDERGVPRMMEQIDDVCIMGIKM